MQALDEIAQKEFSYGSMKSIEIIKKNINVSRVVKQLKKNPQDSKGIIKKKLKILNLLRSWV